MIKDVRILMVEKLQRTVLWLLLLLPMATVGQTTITMQHHGSEQHTLAVGTTYTILDPGGSNNYNSNCSDTLTLQSVGNRPFVLHGSYNIGAGDYLKICQGPSLDYPIENYYNTGNGSIEIYCYSGAVTLYFYSNQFNHAPGFSFNICFPSIYDVEASQVTTTSATFAWQDADYGYSTRWRVHYFLLDDPSRVTTTSSNMAVRNYTSTSLGRGARYGYYVTSNRYYPNYDTSSTCRAPMHKLRTPNVNVCHTCDHFRECIDYTDLSGSERVKCYKGSTVHPDSMECTVGGYGETSADARHVKNSTEGHFAPYTNNGLRTVPLGDSTSVRLGNWNSGHEGESIVYEILVDTNDYNLLTLRYAAAFLMPSGNLESQFPRMTVSLYDQNCIPIEPLCYHIEVIPGNGDGWTTTTEGSNTCKWIDWQKRAIDLSDYHGKTLYLQLTTRDGASSGAAFGYFTLHCGRKQVERMSHCGGSIANTFYAPGGYDYYRWYAANAPGTILSTTDSLSVTAGGLYQCYVGSTGRLATDTLCGFVINALAAPHYPQAAFTDSIIAGRCSFRVKFTNRSKVVDAQGVPLWTNEDCESALWNFGNGQTATTYNAEAVYSDTGTYVVTLVVGIAGGQCTDTIRDTIRLDWLYPRGYLVGDTSICPLDAVNFNAYNTTSCMYYIEMGGETFPHSYTSLEIEQGELTESFWVTCHMEDSNQCRDTVHYQVVVHPTYNEYDTLTACTDNLPISWRDQYFNTWASTNNYTYNRQTAQYGCDSTVHLHLHVNQSYHHSATVAYCESITQYTYADTVFPSLGAHQYTFHLPTGCDSTLNLNLIAVDFPRDTFIVDICRGGTYVGHHFYIPSSDTQTPGTFNYNYIVSDPSGCDSILLLVLRVWPQTTHSVYDTVVENALPVFFNGVMFNHAVSDTVFHLGNSHGCDSMLHYWLTVHWNVTSSENRTICANQLPYSWNGKTFTAAGTKTATLQARTGADSIVTMTLTVNPTYSTTATAAICDNQSYTWHGSTLTQAGSYPIHLQSVAGCDSLATLQLTVNPTYAHNIYHTICNDASFTYNGTNYTTPGSYPHQFTSAAGCDSTVTLNLTVNVVTYSTVEQTVLQRQLPYTLNGVTFSGDVSNQTVVINNVAGCDSIIDFTLHVLWNIYDTASRTVCDDLLPYHWNARTFMATGTQNDTLTAANGADSVITMHLTVNPTYDLHYYDTICNDAQYSFATHTFTQTGVYTDSLQTYRSCDSVQTLHLQVWAVTYATMLDTVVENALPHSYLGVSFTGPVTDSTLHTTNVHGCDSVVTYSLWVHWNVSHSVDSTICENNLPLHWNARTFTSAGTQRDTLLAWTGADSVVVMNLTVDTNTHSVVYDTVLQNALPHLFNGQWFADSVTAAQVNIPNDRGCDSVITYSLYVYRNQRTVVDSTLCENSAPLLWNGKSFNATGSDSTLLVGANGVDSLVVMRVTVDTNTHAVLTDTVVQNALPFTWHHRTFTLQDMQGGDVRYRESQMLDTLMNVHGCDSLVTLRLFVWWNRTASADSTLCEGRYPFTWNNIVFDSAATQQALLVTTHGADSLLTMNVDTWWNTYSTYLDTVVENNLPHAFNDSLFTTAVSHRPVIVANTHGCDSVIDYSLHVHWNIHVNFDSIICDNFLPLAWGLESFTAAGVRTDTLPAASGADSITTLTLTVHPTYDFHRYDTICNDASYTFQGTTYTATGIYPHLLTSSLGCDSVETLHLQVWPVTYATYLDTVVENDLPHSYLTYSFADSISHTTLHTLNHHGCDSIIDYSLWVHWNVFNTVDSVICENSVPFQWNARIFTWSDLTLTPGEALATGTLRDTLTAWTGADSVLTMNVTVKMNSHTAFADTVIENALPYSFLDSLFFDSVTDSHVIIPAANGCDSITHFSLHVWWNVIHIVDTGECVNNLPFTLWGHTFTTDDIQYDSMLTTHGADSIIHITFSVWPTYTTDRYDTICDYSGMMIPGLEYITLFPTVTIHGCDSLETRHLWANPVSYTTVHDTIAASQLPYTYNGVVYNGEVAGVQRILTNQYLCDSIVNFSLSVFPTLYGSDDSTICPDRLPLVWGGCTFTQAGSLVDSLFASTGADSIVTRTLHVAQDFVTHVYDTSCSNTAFYFFDSVYYATTTDSAHYTAVNSCDSTVWLHLTVYAPTSSTVVDTIPQGELPYNYHGYIFDNDVSDTVLTITNFHSCDSVVTYTMHVYRSDTTYYDTSLCEQYLPIVIHGVIFSAAGTGQYSHIGSNGVDSINVVTLHTWPVFHWTDTAETCDSFTWMDGITYTTSTTLPSLHLASQHGCDSIIDLHLTLHHSVELSDVVSACDTYVWMDGITYTADTVGVRFHHQTVYGCDSVIVLNLAVHSSFFHNSVDTICIGTAFDFNGMELRTEGVYFDSLRSAYNCDSVYREDLTVLLLPEISFDTDYNCETRYYTVTATTNVPYYRWSSFPDDPMLVGQEASSTIRVKPMTHETYTFFADYYDVPTCPNTRELYLSPLLKPHAVMETTPDFLSGDEPKLIAINRSTNEARHDWYLNGDWYSDANRISYIADAHDDSVSLLLVAVNGLCSDTTYRVVPFRKASIWAANAFTPGEDVNNRFYVYGTDIIDYEINIYTRGGALVYHSIDMDEGWDGRCDGVEMPQAAYVWVLVYTDNTAPSNKKKKVGTVTLLR